MKDGHNKPIVVTTPHAVTTSQVSFDKNGFDDLVSSKGYELLYEKAIKCPCTDKASGEARPSCGNCRATGYVFINKTSTRMTVQSINRPTKNQKWTEDDRGTVQITAKSENRLAFMDRITLMDIESISSENIRVKKSTSVGSIFGYLFYTPTEIEFAFLFINEDTPLKKLVLGTDYTIQNNKIKLVSSFNEYIDVNLDYLTISVRYKYNPTYNVIDITRESRKNRKKDNREVEVLQDLPMSCIARKTHYIYDAPDFWGESVFDNSNT